MHALSVCNHGNRVRGWTSCQALLPMQSWAAMHVTVNGMTCVLTASAAAVLCRAARLHGLYCALHGAHFSA